MLVGLIQLLHDDDTEEHRDLFVDELLNAKFMAPVIITPEPIRHPDGRPMILGESKITFPMLKNGNGEKFFMAFTDPVEYKKWTDRNRPLNTFNMKFDNFVGMVFTPDSMGNESEAQGFVINPYGVNMVVSKALMAGIMAAKLPAVKEQIDAIREELDNPKEDVEETPETETASEEA